MVLPFTAISHSVNETRAVGAALALSLQAGQVLGLIGTLGMGKTELVRGLVAALNAAAPVRSPSFSLVNIYETPNFPIYHFDFYRLKSARDLVEIGFDDYVYGAGVCMVEWADMFDGVLPDNTIYINFFDTADGAREIKILNKQLFGKGSAL